MDFSPPPIMSVTSMKNIKINGMYLFSVLTKNYILKLRIFQLIQKFIRRASYYKNLMVSHVTANRGTKYDAKERNDTAIGRDVIQA